MLGIEIDIGSRRVVGRPCVSDRSLYTHLLEAYVGMVNLRLNRALRECGGSSVGRAGRVMWKTEISKVVASICIG
jgi:hypothetical protein